MPSRLANTAAPCVLPQRKTMGVQRPGCSGCGLIRGTHLAYLYRASGTPTQRAHVRLTAQREPLRHVREVRRAEKCVAHVACLGDATRGPPPVGAVGSSPGCPKGSHRAKETTMSQSPAITRRHFLRTGVVGAGLFLVRPFGGIRHVYADALPGGTLDPTTIPKYVTP